MVLEKNAELVLNVCRVLIKSVDETANLPDLQSIYHTPSKITYTSRGDYTENGNLFTKSLRLSFPGLGTLDFRNFNEMIRGMYHVFIVLENGEVYEVATEQFPMSCSTDFDINTGHQVVFSSIAPAEIKYLETIVIPTPGEPPPPPSILEEMFDYEFDFLLA